MEKKNRRTPQADPQWWRGAIVYQIYPRSFMDSDGDGIGDLRGIISRLDYIASLGVDMVWLNPVFTSPNDDNGYDISDYYSVMPEFGTMEDLEELIDGLHSRGIRIMLDLVLNHSSDEHPWFRDARLSRRNPFYDFYHWWPAGDGPPPMRRSFFDIAQNAWQYNEPTDSWYLHYFSPKQPDLNWENPAVREHMHDVLRFWARKGVDGFRLDSVTYISKVDGYPEIDLREHPNCFSAYCEGPNLHGYLREMYREVFGPYGVVTVGEGSGLSASRIAPFIDPADPQLDMIYGFGPSEVRNYTGPDSPDTGIPYSLSALKEMFAEWDKGAGRGWPSVYLGNHDQPRMISRFASDKPEFRDLSAKMLATFLLTLRGTVYWYNGDEIGMVSPAFRDISKYRDLATLNEYDRLKEEGHDMETHMERHRHYSRDNSRTPFQWDSSVHAGFSDSRPWIDPNPDFAVRNLREQEKDEGSVLNYFRRMTGLRRGNDILRYGSFELTDRDNPKVFSYRRQLGGERFDIILNFSPRAAVSQATVGTTAELLITNYNTTPVIKDEGAIALRPYEALVFRINQ